MSGMEIPYLKYSFNETEDRIICSFLKNNAVDTPRKASLAGKIIGTTISYGLSYGVPFAAGFIVGYAEEKGLNMHQSLEALLLAGPSGSMGAFVAGMLSLVRKPICMVYNNPDARNEWNRMMQGRVGGEKRIETLEMIATRQHYVRDMTTKAVALTAVKTGAGYFLGVMIGKYAGKLG